MPNWCSNELTIRGSSKELAKLVEKANNEAENIEFSLEKLLPMPESEDKNNWYEWRLANWGTKWDLSDINNSSGFDPEKDEEYCIGFSTAWSPPLEAFVNISKDYPNLEFSIFYTEPGADFCGQAEIQNGGIDDNCVTYSEQFGCGIEFLVDEAQIVDDEIQVPVMATSADDPYDLSSEVKSIKWIMTMPLDLEEDDVDSAYGDTIDFNLPDNEVSTNDFYDKYYESDYKIKDDIIDNLDAIKKSANYNKLNAEVVETEKPKAPRRKI